MSESDQSGAGRREVAYRIFATEFNDANFSFSESDEERAPSYVITPTGARANRLFLVGVLTEIEQVSDNVLRARVADPTGAFVLYAGQYQPDEQAFLEQASPPAFVAVTGKARTFTPDDSDQVFTSIRPESISEVDAETRDRWSLQAAKHTTQRIGWMAQALSLNIGEGLREMLVDRGADDGLAHGIELAIERYGTTPTYLDSLREMSLDAARVVAGEKDEIDGVDLSPDADGAVTIDELTETVAVDLADSATTVRSVDATESSTGETSAKDESEPPVSESEPTVSESEPPVSESESPSEETDTSTEGTDTTSESASTSRSGSETDETAQPAVETTQEPDTVDSSPDVTESDSGEDELGDFDPEEFELEDETRAEVEEEFGTEFQTGTEVDEPGEAGIETPEEIEDEPPASAPEESVDTSSEPTDEAVGKEATDDPPAQQAAEPGDQQDAVEQTADEGDGKAEPDDLQAAVVELMGELDAGDGADREDLIAEMDARYGTDRDAVESAIQDALMDGQCYEPDDSLLKPI